MSGPIEFHQVLDAAPDAMIVLDRRGRVAALNQEAERFFGWNEVELLGQPMSRFIPPRFHALLGQDPEGKGGSASAPMNGGTVSCFARRRDGSEFPVELARRPWGSALMHCPWSPCGT